MATLPRMTKANLDDGADSPKLARAEIAANFDNINAAIDLLNGSTATVNMYMKSTANGPAYAELPDRSIPLPKLAAGTPGKVIGYDSNGLPSEMTSGATIQNSSIDIAKLANNTPNTVIGFNGSGAPALLPMPSGGAMSYDSMFWAQETTPAGVSGGTSIGGTVAPYRFNYRKFNTIKVNNISGLVVSDDLTEIRGFPPGRYFCQASSMQYSTYHHFMRISKYGGAEAHIYSMPYFSHHEHGNGYPAITEGWVVFENNTPADNKIRVEHWTHFARASTGLGWTPLAAAGIAIGMPNIWADIKIFRA